MEAYRSASVLAGASVIMLSMLLAHKGEPLKEEFSIMLWVAFQKITWSLFTIHRISSGGGWVFTEQLNDIS